MRDKLNEFIETISIFEILGYTKEEGNILNEKYKSDDLCKKCDYKNTGKCKICLFVLDSPLERKLYVELLKIGIDFKVQYPINWKGEFVYLRSNKITKEDVKEKQILTISDFYIKSDKGEICVYTDGHTYHERTEDQAKRDRRIDRVLQEKGYKVLRYTGKEIRNEMGKVISEIKEWSNF